MLAKRKSHVHASLIQKLNIGFDTEICFGRKK